MVESPQTDGGQDLTTNEGADTGAAIRRAERYRELLERTDPSIKKRRLEEELDGRANPDGTQLPGLREQLFAAVRQAFSQDAFIAKRETASFAEDELTAEMWERDQAAAVYNQQMFWMQVEYLESLVAETETELEKLKTAGTPAAASGRRSRQGTALRPV